VNSCAAGEIERSRAMVDEDTLGIVYESSRGDLLFQTILLVGSCYLIGINNARNVCTCDLNQHGDGQFGDNVGDCGYIAN
jgi:hypothetical protein